MHSPKQTYDEWFSAAFGQSVPAPTNRVAFSLPENTPWGHKAHCALLNVELECAEELLIEAATKSKGAIAEFGIFEGWWINRFAEMSEKLKLRRNIYGFDSFEGLSEPSKDKDSDFWKRGMYACDLETVKRNVKASERPNIHLVKGWFSDSLKTPEAQEIKEFCFVRIDCDIYEPAKQCLEYLGPRLADKSILVFDDWPHMLGVGEQLAFDEWRKTVPELMFEFLFYGTIGHFYLRVHRL